MIDLNIPIHLRNWEFVNGSVGQLEDTPGNKVVTVLHFCAPVSSNIPLYTKRLVTTGSVSAEVSLNVIRSPDQDWLRQAFGDNAIGPIFGNKGTLKFNDISDHRGAYPYILCSIIFNNKVADWLKIHPHHPNAVDILEESIITGDIPRDNDKIIAIRLLNAYIKSVESEGAVRYDDVTLLFEQYFIKNSNNLILSRCLALASENALQKAVVEKYAGLSWTEWLRKKNSIKDLVIMNESDLRNAVLSFIDSVIKHHIEDRRWVEPFWNSKSTTTHKGDKVYIKASPKSEPEIQPTLDVLFIEGLEASGIRVSRETDEGIGNLDFCFSFNTDDGKLFKVNLEVKLAHHGKIEHGIATQLPRYMKANRSANGIYMVFWFKDSKRKYFSRPKDTKESFLAFLDETAASVKRINAVDIIVRLVDASISDSASV